MFVRSGFRPLAPFLRYCSAASKYESCYDLALSRLSDSSKKADWNGLIEEMIDAGIPCYSEQQRRSILRTINYRHDVHRGNASMMDSVVGFKKRIESSLTDTNLDAFILKVIRDVGDVQLGLSYLDYLEKTRKKSLTLKHRILALETAGRFHEFIKDPSVDERVRSLATETISIIEELGVQKQNIFYVISALSNTTAWKDQALNLYLNNVVIPDKEDIEERITSASVKAGEHLGRRILYEEGPTSNFWSVVNHENFITRNFQLRYRQVEEIQSSHDRLYLEYLKTSQTWEDMEALFTFLRDHRSFITWDIARHIKDTIDKWDQSHLVKVSEISSSGVCKSCNTVLEKESFTQSHINRLKNAIFDKCLKKDDIYLTSLPGEVKKFQNFCNQIPNYDLVIDGLNVAHAHMPKFERGSISKTNLGRKLISTQSKNLKGILTTLHKRGKTKILLIYRHGIERLPDYEEIRRMAYIYSTKRDSQDDPFLILATLIGGTGTLFLSNDRLRQHNYLLETGDLQRLFTRWQVAHQCFHKIWVTRSKAEEKINYRYMITDPQGCEIRVQNKDNVWHIPLIHRYNEEKGHLTVPKHWLCIKKSSV